MNGKPKQITSSLWSGRKEGKNKVEKKKEEKKTFIALDIAQNTLQNKIIIFL